MTTSERVLVRRWSRDQVTLRAAIALLPVVAAWCTVTLGQPPGWWLVMLVGGLSGWWAVRPESAVGIVSLLVVSLWWAFVAVAASWWFALPACLLLAAHLAATVSAFGPAEASICAGTWRRWALRWVTLSGGGLVVVAGLVAADQVDAAALRALWPGAVLAVLVVGAAGLAASSTPGE